MKGRNKLVLVVDDDPRMLQLFEEALVAEDYQVVTADNGLEALALLNEVQPDVVLVDKVMPDMSGYTLCQHIRKSSRVPMVMVTTGDYYEEMAKGIAAGADDVLLEPFTAAELLERLKTALSLAPWLRLQKTVHLYRTPAWFFQPEARPFDDLAYAVESNMQCLPNSCN